MGASLHPGWTAPGPAESRRRDLESVRRRGTPADDPIDRLSPRQIAILRRIAAGDRTEDVAADLRIGIFTVKNHLSRAYRVLGIAGGRRNCKAARACYLLGLRDGRSEG